MEDNGYAKSYILLLKTEINWLQKKAGTVSSYEEACSVREKQTESPEMKRRYRLEYGILKRFDTGIYPDYRMREPLVKYGSYYQLCPEFKEVIDSYKKADTARGLKPNTVKGNASAGACFLLFMQESGLHHMSNIDENLVMFFFTDDSGNVSLSSGYKKQIAAVFKADLGIYTAAARRVLAYLPCIRPSRKNIQYLQPEENQELHGLFDDSEKCGLCLRDKAIGSLLFFTGLRPCDIAAFVLDDIDWEKDEIHIIQNKTDVPLILPLTAVIGNAIYDYITEERPTSSERHIFLGKNRPHDPISAGALWHVASRMYGAASVRLEDGDRRGTHLFRYNAENIFLTVA